MSTMQEPPREVLRPICSNFNLRRKPVPAKKDESSRNQGVATSAASLSPSKGNQLLQTTTPPSPPTDMFRQSVSCDNNDKQRLLEKINSDVFEDLADSPTPVRYTLPRATSTTAQTSTNRPQYSRPRLKDYFGANGLPPNAPSIRRAPRATSGFRTSQHTKNHRSHAQAQANGIVSTTHGPLTPTSHKYSCERPHTTPSSHTALSARTSSSPPTIASANPSTTGSGTPRAFHSLTPASSIATVRTSPPPLFANASPDIFESPRSPTPTPAGFSMSPSLPLPPPPYRITDCHRSEPKSFFDEGSDDEDELDVGTRKQRRKKCAARWDRMLMINARGCRGKKETKAKMRDGNGIARLVRKILACGCLEGEDLE